ncbi:MAG TPA: hypothetical protein DEA08_16235 [Planctomycetes bacterium]|nr:hypothetical protein [Planctomycetota bacterium]
MFLFLPESNEADARPSVNIALVASIALVSVLLWGIGLDSALASTAFVLQRGADFNPLQLIGVAWVHLNLGHLLGNLLVLLALGNPLEARIGAGRYLALFLGSVFVGSLGSLLIGSHAALVGASGGVMGVALAFLVVCPLRRVRLALWVPALFALPIALVGVANAGPALFVFAIATLGWLVRSVLSCSERPPEGVILRALGFRSLALAGMWLVLLSLASDLVVATLGISGLLNVGVWAHLGGAALGALLGLWWGSEVAERGEARSLLQLLGLTATPAPALAGARVLAPYPEGIGTPRQDRRPSAGPLAGRRPSFRPRVLQGGAAREARPTTGPLLRRPPARPDLDYAPRRREPPTQGQLARRRVARPDSFDRWAAEQRRGG